MVFVGIFGIVVFVHEIIAQLSYDPTWTDVVAAHPDAGMECHMAIMERIQDTKGLVYGSPYAVDDSGQRMSVAEIKELATHMVLDSDWRPPECGG